MIKVTNFHTNNIAWVNAALISIIVARPEGGTLITIQGDDTFLVTESVEEILSSPMRLVTPS